MAATAERPGSSDERLYLQARLILAGLLFMAATYEFLWSSQRVQWTLFWFLCALFLGSTLALWAGLRRRERPAGRLLLLIVVPDLAVIGGLAFALHGSEDAFYPVAVLISIAYALSTGRRVAWSIGVAAALAYAFGHLFAHQLAGIDLFMFAVKTAAIPLIAGMVANSVQKRRDREEETERAVHERDSLNRRLERRLSELQAVSEITDLVHSSLDFEKNGPVVLDILSRSLGVDTCCLFVIDKERSETLFSAAHGQVSGMPSRRGALPHATLDDHLSCTPAFDHDHLSVLFCASSEDIERLTGEDRLVLSAVASELVVAVENARLYRLTKKLAVTDELTGLANYRQLQLKLDEEIERAKRYGKRISLVMIDADDFKDFNDTHGHLAGDVALTELGHVISQCVREVDLVARYGGEEFSIVLPETDSAGAYVVAEKVREAVQNHRFTGAGGVRSCSLTVSLGLATYPAHASDKDGLLREADHALYRAKQGGKNRVRTPSQTAATPAKAAGRTDDDLPAARQTGA